MKNEKENLNLVEEELTDFDFEFVHRDSKEKIHDEKLQTKPTTFAKDALKRFAKNKASVVGAVIIGVLLLGSFLSYFSPHNISTPAGELAKLMPKIREADNGFWDGTIDFANKIYDEENETPYGVDPDHIVPGTLKVSDEVTYYDSEANAFATGGYYRFVADKRDGSTFAFYNYSINSRKQQIYFHANQSDNITFKITLGGTDGVAEKRLAPLSVYLAGYTGNDIEMDPRITPILLSENMKAEGEEQVFEINNVSEKMAEAGISTVYFAEFRFEFPTFTDVEGYTLVKSIEFSCADSASERTKTRLADMSFDDANWVAYNTSTDKNPERYWRSTAERLIYRAHARQCSYRLDQYKQVFGVRHNFVIGGSILRTYINNGWCTMSDLDDPTTFKLTNPDSMDCPLRSITAVEKESDNVYQYYGDVVYYRYLGMNSIPYYVFGTDSKGYDMLTLSLSCLKNSLLLAIITSAICLIIGLIWGSVSGYFGGNVDLIMERITDILSGVPWIVVMTLVMLLLGRTYLTFGIAVCLTGWIGTSSRTRTQFYRFKGREYVLASRTLGASDGRLIFRHILPNGLGTIVTGSVLMIPSTIFSEATLSYLGLGLQGTASFGVLLSENQIYLNSRPMLIVFPSIIISLLMISFNLFGNGLRDALNPTLKGGEQ